jgi:hypothetical protein
MQFLGPKTSPIVLIFVKNLCSRLRRELRLGGASVARGRRLPGGHLGARLSSTLCAQGQAQRRN